jgi:hypothetical protein
MCEILSAAAISIVVSICTMFAIAFYRKQKLRLIELSTIGLLVVIGIAMLITKYATPHLCD